MIGRIFKACQKPFAQRQLVEIRRRRDDGKVKRLVVRRRLRESVLLRLEVGNADPGQWPQPLGQPVRRIGNKIQVAQSRTGRTPGSFTLVVNSPEVGDIS